MVPYITILVLSILAILAKRTKKIFRFITVTLMIAFSSLRMVGTDWGLYRALYKNRIYQSRFDVGFKWLMNLCYSLSKGNYFFLTFMVSTISIIIFYYTISKHSTKKEVSLFLFIVLGYYTMSFNIMKQILALCITFYGVKYILTNNLFKYLLVIFIASLFHQTALIMIPFYWIANLTINKKVIVISVICSFLSFILFNPIFNFVTTISGKYILYNTYDYNISAGVGTWLNVIFYSIIVIFLALNYKKMIKADENNKKFLNICLFAIPILILSLKNNLFYRISLYPLIYLTLLLCQFDKIFNKSSRHNIVAMICIVFIVYYFLYTYSFGNVYPYKWII